MGDNKGGADRSEVGGRIGFGRGRTDEVECRKWKVEVVIMRKKVGT